MKNILTAKVKQIKVRLLLDVHLEVVMKTILQSKEAVMEGILQSKEKSALPIISMNQRLNRRHQSLQLLFSF
jgi:hypothetical protein